MPRKSIAEGPNRGIKYEVKINQLLKDKYLQQKSIISGGTSDAPDGYFRYKKKNYPMEIKRDLSADFAQIELRWSLEKKFYFSERTKNPAFREYLTKESGFLSKINKIWTKKPLKFTKHSLISSDRHTDLNNFPDIREEVEITFIEKFYNSKNPPVHYIQIGTRGFYYMGEDILNLNIPRINGKPILRARIKTRSSINNKYGFLVAIKLRGIQPSTHDIEELSDRKFPFPN